MYYGCRKQYADYCALVRVTWIVGSVWCSMAGTCANIHMILQRQQQVPASTATSRPTILEYVCIQKLGVASNLFIVDMKAINQYRDYCIVEYLK